MTWQLTEVVRYAEKLLALTAGTVLSGFVSFAYLWRGGHDARLLAEVFQVFAVALYVAATVNLLRLRRKAVDARDRAEKLSNT